MVLKKSIDFADSSSPRRAIADTSGICWLSSREMCIRDSNHMAVGEERRTRIIDLINKRDQAEEEFKKECKPAVSVYMDNFPKIDVLKDYRRLLSDPEKLCHLCGSALIPEVAEYVAGQCQLIEKREKNILLS